MTDINIQEVLDTEMQDNDSGASTIRGYLKALLFALWEEGEGFSGKRPFGNSGWDGDLAFPLVRAKIIKGKIYTEEDGDEIDQYLDDYDSRALNNIIRKCIEAL